MNNNLTTTKLNAKFVLEKTKNLLDITNKLLSKRDTFQPVDICKYKPFLRDRGHSDSINSIFITSNDKYIISGSSDKTIKIWDIQNGECLNTLYGHSPKFVQISPDGNSIIFVDFINDEIIEIFDIQSKKSLIRISISEEEEDVDEEGIPYTYSVYSITISQDGNYIISGNSNNTIKIYDIHSGNLFKTLDYYIDDDVLDNNHISTISIGPDGNKIVFGTQCGTIEIMDIEKSEMIYGISSDRSWVTSLAISPAETIIVSASFDGTIKIWDMESKKCLKSFYQYEGSSVEFVEFMEENSNCIVTHDKWTCTESVWNVQSGECLETYGRSYIKNLREEWLISQGEFTFIHGDDCKTTLKVIDNQNGKCMNTLVVHSKEITSVASRPYGNYIISGSVDDTFKIWDKKRGELLCTMYHSHGITIDKDGYFIGEDYNLEEYIRIKEKPLTQRKLTKEELEHFCKVKYENKNHIPEIDIDEDEPF